MPIEPPRDQKQPQPFDSNKRWYDEYHALCGRLRAYEIETVKLRRHIQGLERQVQAEALTKETIHDLDTSELLHLAQERIALARAVVAELRKRHVALPDELRDLFVEATGRTSVARVDTTEEGTFDEVVPKKRKSRKRASFETEIGEGLWIEEPVTDPVAYMLYDRMWNMIYDLALPHALRILAEQDRAAQGALPTTA